MQVSEILTIKGTALFTIPSSKTLAEGIAIMAEKDVGSLVCFDGSRMAGMLTFREVFKAMHQRGADAGSLRIADIMAPEPRCAAPNMEIGDLRRMMVDMHIRYLPVMDGNTLLGVISFHDVARAVLEEQSFENRMLKAYIHDQPVEQQATGR